ncbi:MAG: mevalonate kinase [Pseudomonadales bacterium]
MIIEAKAYARAGLIGNPSDGYFGKTISVILRNFSATVRCFESPRLSIEPCQQDQMVFRSLQDLQEDVRQNGYYGGLRLIKAAIKRFADHCREHSIELDGRNFTMEYQTDIPVRIGLAGSSGIVTATLKALMTFYAVEIADHDLARLALSVELDELDIGAGLQDRVIQAYEGVVFMDFDQQLMNRRGYGEYESIQPASLPPLFVAYHSDLAEGTEVSHNDLRSRFMRKDPEVIAAMKEFAALAAQAKEYLLNNNGEAIAKLMSDNFKLRTELLNVSEGNRQLVKVANRLGCHAKLAGSGGAVIGVYDGDESLFEHLQKDYAEMGATLIKPIIENKSD